MLILIFARPQQGARPPRYDRGAGEIAADVAGFSQDDDCLFEPKPDPWTVDESQRPLRKGFERSPAFAR